MSGQRLIDAEEFDADAVESADQLLIPVYDVYYALFENNVLDVGHLKADDATENEKAVYNAFLIKASEIFATLKDQLLTNDPSHTRIWRNSIRSMNLTLSMIC